MKVPRVSIGRAMLVVAIIAADCAMVREHTREIRNSLSHILPPPDDPADRIPFYLAFLFVNILAVGLFRLAGGPMRSRPFLVGFEVTGISTLVAYYAANRLHLTGSLDEWTTEFVEPVIMYVYLYISPLVIVSGLFAVLMLAVAAIGGGVAKLVARFGPRRRTHAESPTGEL